MEACKLEALTGLLRAPVRVILGSDNGAYQQWLATGEVDFLEVFEGGGELGLATSREALTRGQGIDRLRASYGQIWDLAKGQGRRRLLRKREW